MVEQITMNFDETLELDYLVEDISNDTINVKDEPSNFSTEIGYIRKEIGVFDPPGAGTYQLEINGQTIEIKVTNIPDSVDYQWLSADFASPWPANVGGIDMTVSGLMSDGAAFGGEGGVAGDGTDDYGTAPITQSWYNQDTLTLAFSINTTESDYTIMGAQDSNGWVRFSVNDDASGPIEVDFNSTSSTDDSLKVSGSTTITDGVDRAVVISKSANSAGDIRIWVGDSSSFSEDSTTIHTNGSFTPSELSRDWGFYDYNNKGSIGGNFPWDATVGRFEFAGTAWDQTEAQDFYDRLPWT